MNAPPLSLAPVDPGSVAPLLVMMGEFNAGEAIAWSADAGEPALRTLLGSPELGAVRLVVEGAEVVGYFIVTFGFDLEWSGRDAFLTELYLVPSARGRGLGARVLPLVEQLAAGLSVRALHLQVRTENLAARRLYEGAGFVAPPRLLMTKPLAPR